MDRLGQDVDLQVHVDLAAEPEGRVSPGGLEKASLEAGVAPLVVVVPAAATWILALDWVFAETQ